MGIIFFHAELGVEPDHHHSLESQLGTQEKLNIIQTWKDLTHCGLVMQICVFKLQLCRTFDANLHF